ncbi:MAG: HDOD domain-containing protein [bacterium]
MESIQHKEKKLADLIRLVNQSHISSIRSVVSNILKVFNNPKSTAQDLKDIIEVDPPLTAKILRAANSAYYSPRVKISDIKSAIIWLGFDALKELALSQKVCEIFNKDENIEGYSRIDLWKHSVCVGMLGKMIYRKEVGERGDNIYSAGLMHDIGIIAEDQFLQDEFREIIRESTVNKKNLSQTEYKILGYNHADIGKAITKAWDFPLDLVEAIGYHHNPTAAPLEYHKITATLYISNYLCHERGLGYSPSPYIDKDIFIQCLKTLGVKLYAIDLIMHDMEEELHKMIDMEFF